MSEAISIANFAWLYESPVAQIIIGAGITAFCSWHFYKKAGDDLIKETRLLKEKNQLILTCLEQAGLVELMWKDGEIIGIKNWKIKPKGTDSLSVPEPSIGHCKQGNNDEFK